MVQQVGKHTVTVEFMAHSISLDSGRKMCQNASAASFWQWCSSLSPRTGIKCHKSVIPSTEGYRYCVVCPLCPPFGVAHSCRYCLCTHTHVPTILLSAYATSCFRMHRHALESSPLHGALVSANAIHELVLSSNSRAYKCFSSS